MIAAALRADLSDLSAFVEGLAVRLEGALPGLVEVKRARRGLRGPKLVTEITVEADGQRLDLQRDGDRIRAARARSSGGIVLKREALDLEVWLQALVAVVAAQARHSERARQALAKLVLEP